MILQTLQAEMGALAVQIKQAKDEIERKEKLFQKLNDQLFLLQQLEGQGYTISEPKPQEEEHIEEPAVDTSAGPESNE